MPEHLDAITTISRDMFYCILASKLPSQIFFLKKHLPPDHKISEKKTLTNFFFYLALNNVEIFHIRDTMNKIALQCVLTEVVYY